MDKQFVPYNLSLRLAGLDFGENCMAYYFKGGKINNYFNKYYNNKKIPSTQPFQFHCTAPLWQQVFDWTSSKVDLKIYYPSSYEEKVKLLERLIETIEEVCNYEN
jgi:hypothetical protein